MKNRFSMEMDEYLPLRDAVYKTLRQAILRGELKPGERLMEIALAEELGVSRTPIRERPDRRAGSPYRTGAHGYRQGLPDDRT